MESMQRIPLEEFINIKKLYLPEKKLRELPGSLAYLYHHGSLQITSLSEANKLEIESLDWSGQNLSAINSAAHALLKHLPRIRRANFSRNHLVGLLKRCTTCQF